MKKFLMIVLAMIFIASSVSAWTITTNSSIAHSKNRYSFTVINNSTNSTYQYTNWGMPWRFAGRATPMDITVTMITSSLDQPAYIHCSVVSSKTLHFCVQRMVAKGAAYAKATVTIYMPAPSIK